MWTRIATRRFEVKNKRLHHRAILLLLLLLVLSFAIGLRIWQPRIVMGIRKSLSSGMV